MAQFGRFYVPPLRAAFNVAWETIKSTIPDDSPCLDALRAATGRGPVGGDRPREPGEHVRFAQFGPDGRPAGDATELASMPGADGGFAGEGGGGAGGVAEDALGPAGARQLSYQQSLGGASMASVDLEDGGCGEFGEGGGRRHKINEWQAAWNVTNAIQVTKWENVHATLSALCTEHIQEVGHQPPYPGHVHRVSAVRRAARRLLGHRRHDRHRVHLLLHGQDPGGVPVRAGPGDRAARARARLVRGHRARVLRAAVGRPRGQRGAAHRAAHDVHPVRGGVRRPHEGHVPGRRHRHPLLDDARRHLPHPAGLPQVAAHGVAAQLLVHHVPLGDQRRHPGLLLAGDRRLGLVQGQVVHRHGELPHLAGRHCVQLHVPDLPAQPGRQPHRPLQVRLDAQLEPRSRSRLQVALRIPLLPHVPERHSAGYHKQPALAGLQGLRQLLPGGEGGALVPAALLRRVRAAGESPFQGPARHHLPHHLGAGRRAQSVGAGVPSGRGGGHGAHGHLHPALRHPHGLHRQLHRHHALLHLALLLPPQAQAAVPRLGHGRVRLLRHLPRRALLHHRRVRLGLRAHQSLRDRPALLEGFRARAASRLAHAPQLQPVQQRALAPKERSSL